MEYFNAVGDGDDDDDDGRLLLSGNGDVVLSCSGVDLGKGRI
jgi:hypothetical protein